MAPQRCICTNPSNCENVTLYGKGDSADVIKDLAGLSGWAQSNHKGPNERDGERSESE